MDKGLYFSCTIGELDSATFDVVEFTLEEALSSLFTLTLTLSSANPDIDLQPQLLQKASLTIFSDGQKQRTVNGLVESAVRGDIGFKRSFYTFTIRPALWQLTLTKDSRIFHFKSIPDILNELLKRYHITAENQLMDPHPVREYVTQKRESDYDFFCRLAAEEGIIFWFEEDKLFYSDSHLGMTVGVDVLYNPHSQSSAKEHVINKLQFGAFMRPNEAHLKDYRYSHPDVDLRSKSKDRKIPSAYSVYDSYGRFDDEKTAAQFSRYRLDALQADSEHGIADSNCIQLMPGKLFQLSEHPAASLNSTWQVIAVTHRGALPQSLEDENTGEVAASLTNTLRFISGKQDWRPLFMHKPLADGDEVATVVGPANEEIYVNEDGAVKIHFHWNRYDTPDENASCWVRVIQGWNGDGFGFLSVPRIGQEVLVSYLNGDIDRPLITGAMYNGKNRPPLTLPDNKTQTTFKTQTHKGAGFNELRFEDEAGKEEIYFHAQRDMRSQVNRQLSTLIGENRINHIKQDDYLRVEGERRDEITGDYSQTVSQNVHCRVQNRWLLGAGKEIHLHSDNVLVLDAKSEIVLKVGGSFISINASGITTNRTIALNNACPNLGSPVTPKRPDALREEEAKPKKTLKLFSFSG